MKTAVFAAATLASLASGKELTTANYKTETKGKTVFLKFYAPWVSVCGHYFVIFIGNGWQTSGIEKDLVESVLIHWWRKF